MTMTNYDKTSGATEYAHTFHVMPRLNGPAYAQQATVVPDADKLDKLKMFAIKTLGMTFGNQHPVLIGVGGNFTEGEVMEMTFCVPGNGKHSADELVGELVRYGKSINLTLKPQEKKTHVTALSADPSGTPPMTPERRAELFGMAGRPLPHVSKLTPERRRELGID